MTFLEQNEKVTAYEAQVWQKNQQISLYELVKEKGASDVNTLLGPLPQLLYHYYAITTGNNFIRGRKLSQMYHKHLSVVTLILDSWITYLTTKLVENVVGDDSWYVSQKLGLAAAQFTIKNSNVIDILKGIVSAVILYN